MLAAVPAPDQQGEQALELATVVRRIAQDVQGFGFVGQQVGQQGADYRFGIELIEALVGFHFQLAQTHGLQRQVRGGLLAPQAAGHATVQHQAQVGQVGAQYLRLMHAQRRQYVVVIGAEAGLAMSNQINAAHVRSRPGTLKVPWRLWGWWCPVNEKTYACLNWVPTTLTANKQRRTR